MLNKKKSNNTQKKHSESVAYSHKLAALTKNRKEEILCKKEQSTEQSTVQSNDIYIYGIGVLAVLAIDVYVFFTDINKIGQVIHKQPIKQKLRNMVYF